MTQACGVSAVWTGCDAWRCAVGEGRSRGFATMGGMFPGGAGRMAKKSGKAGKPGKDTGDDGDAGPPLPDLDVVKADMMTHVERLKKSVVKLRGGEANPNMLDHIHVSAYGSSSSLTAVGNVVLRNSNLIVVSPFDATLAPAIATAIRDSGLNLNPSVEDNVVKVPLPKVSKDVREASLKALAKVTEEAKQRVRSIRKDAVDALKDAKGISSDESFRLVKKVQDVTNEVIDKLSAVADARKTEINNS